VLLLAEADDFLIIRKQPVGLPHPLSAYKILAILVKDTFSAYITVILALKS
jgi:hypothetical protein